jgi:hypothetical protein
MKRLASYRDYSISFDGYRFCAAARASTAIVFLRRGSRFNGYRFFCAAARASTAILICAGDPRFDGCRYLHRDPRFHDLLRRVGLTR